MTDRGVRRLLTTVLCAVLALGCSAPAAAPRHHIAVRPFHTLPRHLSALEQPPDTATCQRALRISCYSPSQIQAAYGLPALHAGGVG